MYKSLQDGLEYRAKFEVLKVEQEGDLGIYIYYKDSQIDESDLEVLDLDLLEELIQENRIVELVPSTTPSDDKDRNTFSWYTVVGANILFWGPGLWTFIEGIRGPVQKPWEVCVGAAFMIASLLAVAIRRS